MKSIFQLPISYNANVKRLPKHVVEEVELVDNQTHDATTPLPVYTNIFHPHTNKTDSNRALLKYMASLYTTDIEFLQQTQQVIQTLHKPIYTPPTDSSYQDQWNHIQTERAFCTTYHFIDGPWDVLKQLNDSPSFLQVMSVYQLGLPLLSLAMPLLVLMLPFFILRVQGIRISMDVYMELLKRMIGNHSIYKLFTQGSITEPRMLLYLLLMSAFYLFSMYQHVMSCLSFYKNTTFICTHLNQTTHYIVQTLERINYWERVTKEMSAYAPFNKVLSQHVAKLTELRHMLSNWNRHSFLFNNGTMMHTFYQLHQTSAFQISMEYSFQFNQYLDWMCVLSECNKQGKLQPATFTQEHKQKPTFKGIYNPAYIHREQTDEQIRHNDCDLRKHLILTGPNASGKTTLLKSVLLNVLLTQQFGMGCYQSLTLKPYDYLHCYLNIPDTVGRDSLFQAEARRCKEMMDAIQQYPQQTHLCVLDELFSGTNPEEAVASATAFMKYLANRSSTTLLLTTHFTDLCQQLDKHKRIQNRHMEAMTDGHTFTYTYRMKKGISTLKGGMQILKQMDFPKEMFTE